MLFSKSKETLLTSVPAQSFHSLKKDSPISSYWISPFHSLFCRYAIPSGYGMGEGKLDLPIDLILDERPYYDRSGDMALRATHKNELLCGR